ncbi:hypothetical protein CRYUN_Cryun10bG0052500 [Craigia yunnanensis]
MKNVFHCIWKIRGELQVKEVGEKIFIFQFDEWWEKERVLIQQPWMFNKSLVLFRDFYGFSSPETICMDWCLFWVQIHGLPLGLMNEKIIIAVGKMIGQVLKMDADGE